MGSARGARLLRCTLARGCQGLRVAPAPRVARRGEANTRVTTPLTAMAFCTAASASLRTCSVSGAAPVPAGSAAGASPPAGGTAVAVVSMVAVAGSTGAALGVPGAGASAPGTGGPLAPAAGACRRIPSKRVGKRMKAGGRPQECQPRRTSSNLQRPDGQIHGSPSACAACMALAMISAISFLAASVPLTCARASRAPPPHPNQSPPAAPAATAPPAGVARGRPPGRAARKGAAHSHAPRPRTAS